MDNKSFVPNLTILLDSSYMQEVSWKDEQSENENACYLIYLQYLGTQKMQWQKTLIIRVLKLCIIFTSNSSYIHSISFSLRHWTASS